VDICPEKIV